MELYVVCHNESLIDEGDVTYPIAVFDSYDKVEALAGAIGYPKYREDTEEFRPAEEDWFKGRKLYGQFLTVNKLTLNRADLTDEV